jgi:hypothetical protein
MNLRILFACLFLALAGCVTTPAERIEKGRSAYASWPPDVQARVKAGEVAPGFTPEQVRMALGDPDRVFTSVTGAGTEEVWAYRNHRPRITFGIGMGGGGGSGFVSGATMVSTGGNYPDEVLRVTFAGGRVSVVEKLK